MKYCQNCGRLFKNELKECAHDGTALIDIQEAFSTHKKPTPFATVENLPVIDHAVPPHEDWSTWQTRNLRRHAPAEEPAREGKTEQRRQLTSMGVVFGMICFLLHMLTALPAAQADATSHVGPATLQESTPTMSSSEIVIVTKSGTVVQKMSSMSPQEGWFAAPPQNTRSHGTAGNIKVARSNSTASR